MHFRHLVLALFIVLPATLQASLEAAIKQDQYQVIFALLDQQLADSPAHPAALFLKALYAQALHRHDAAGHLKTLLNVKPIYGQCLQQLVQQIEERKKIKWPAPQDPGVILVLGHISPSENEPSPLLRRRLKKTLDLAKKYPKHPVLVTGGRMNKAYSESSVMKKWLIKHHLKPSRIITEDKSLDTFENARFSLPLLPEQTKHVLLVTNRFHMERSTLIFRALMKNKIIFPAAAEDGLDSATLNKLNSIEAVSRYRDTLRALDVLKFKQGLALIDIHDPKACHLTT